MESTNRHCRSQVLEPKTGVVGSVMCCPLVNEPPSAVLRAFKDSLLS